MRPHQDIQDVDPRPSTYPRRPGHGGFTLIELLVAMAIFITVMGGVTLLFNSAIRTTKQGYLNQDAFEIARGAMDILERDLSRSFTSLDHGDVFNFYGTPIGFTFVGMITADESSDPNLARVTYVMYHLPTSIENVVGAIGIYETVDADRINTFSLLRYIEIGKEDLESFPVDWNLPAALETNLLQTLIDTSVEVAIFDGLCDEDDVTCIEEVEKAKKRELWIRMLSGGDFEVPSAWGSDGILGLDPFDYVIAEKIRFLGSESLGCEGVDFDSFDDLDVPLDFDDLIFSGFDCTVAASPVSTTCASVQFDFIEHPPWITVNQNFAAIARSDDPLPFFTYRDYGTRIRTNGCGKKVFKDDPLNPGFPPLDDFGVPILIPETEVAPIDLQFWNDTRNAEYLLLRANDILTNEIDEDGDNVLNNPNEADGLNLGSPLVARAPIEISTNFTLFLPSPYPGAPDFNRKFTMVIDLPSGYRRTFESPAPASL